MRLSLFDAALYVIALGLSTGASVWLSMVVFGEPRLLESLMACAAGQLLAFAIIRWQERRQSKQRGEQ